MIHCLGFAGMPLTSRVRDLLFITAWGMYNAGEKRVEIKDTEYEGRMTSDFEYATLGNLFGIKFTADIEVEEGKTHVEFVVHSSDLIREKFAGNFAQAAKAAWN